jgi:hypothetical protein
MISISQFLINGSQKEPKNVLYCIDTITNNSINNLIRYATFPQLKHSLLFIINASKLQKLYPNITSI